MDYSFKLDYVNKFMAICVNNSHFSEDYPGSGITLNKIYEIDTVMILRSGADIYMLFNDDNNYESYPADWFIPMDVYRKNVIDSILE